MSSVCLLKPPIPPEIQAICTAENLERLKRVLTYIEDIDRPDNGLSVEIAAKIYMKQPLLMENFLCLFAALTNVAKGEPLLNSQKLLFEQPVTLLQNVCATAEKMIEKCGSEGDKKSLRRNIIEPIQTVLSQLMSTDQTETHRWVTAARHNAVGVWLADVQGVPFIGEGNGLQEALRIAMEAVAGKQKLKCSPEEAVMLGQEALSRCVAQAYRSSTGRSIE